MTALNTQHLPFRPLVNAMLLCLVTACASAQVTDNATVMAPTGAKTVYVEDFTLDPAVIQAEGLMGQHAQRRGLLGRLRDRSPLHGRSGSDDPVTHFQTLMATSLVTDLQKAGLTAVRLPAGNALPRSGWVLRGKFLSVDEGNRLKRAVIGFGAGHTGLTVSSVVEDLSAAQAPHQIETLETTAQSRKKPGAIIMPNPYTAAISFVMAGKDTDRDIRHTAEKIAKALVTTLVAPSPTAQPEPQAAPAASAP